MNAAFLLLSTSWLAGADTPPPPPAPPAHAPIAAPVVHGCAGGNCGSVNYGHGCCESTWCDSPGLFARLRDRFSKNDCCDTCSSCAPVTTCNTCAPSYGCCDDGCKGPGLFDRLRDRFKSSSCCEPAPCCAPTTCGSCCDDGCSSPGLFSRLRARFSKSSDCCDSCGSSCGCSGGVISTAPLHAVPMQTMPSVPANPPEKILPPKSGPEKTPADGQIGPGTSSAQPLETDTKYPF